jgi:hypothetical protein
MDLAWYPETNRQQHMGPESDAVHILDALAHIHALLPMPKMSPTSLSIVTDIMESVTIKRVSMAQAA